MAARRRAPTKKALKAALDRQEKAHQYLDIDDLKRMKSPYNPREISDAAMTKLRTSIRHFGAAEPICVNVRSGHIVGAHQRATAAELEGWEKFPVWFVDLDDADEKALNVALNNPEIQGLYEDEKLREVLASIREQDAERLHLTGFNVEQSTLILDGWDADFQKVEKTDPHTDGITSTIFIECRQDDRDALREKLIGFLESLGLEAARVR